MQKVQLIIPPHQKLVLFLLVGVSLVRMKNPTFFQLLRLMVLEQFLDFS